MHSRMVFVMEDTRVTGQSTTQGLDLSSLILVAVLLAAGFILNLTVGRALAITGIQPQFIIASYCLAILLIRPNVVYALAIGALAATIVQLTTSIPGVNYLSDIPAAALMGLFVALSKPSQSKFALLPGLLAMVATLVSGAIFASIASFVVIGVGLPMLMTMLPVVLGTTLANGIVVQLLYVPLQTVFKNRI